MPAVPVPASSIAAREMFPSASQQQRATTPASPASSPIAVRVRGGAHRTIPLPIPTYLDAGVAAQSWSRAAGFPHSARRSCGSGFFGALGLELGWATGFSHPQPQRRWRGARGSGWCHGGDAGDVLWTWADGGGGEERWKERV